MHRIVLSPAAEDELQAAVDWYGDQRAELAMDFLLHVQAAFNAARQRPRSFPLARGELRRVLIKRFPYAIYFRDVSKAVRVVAIRHTARENADLGNL